MTKFCVLPHTKQPQNYKLHILKQERQEHGKEWGTNHINHMGGGGNTQCAESGVFRDLNLFS